MAQCEFRDGNRKCRRQGSGTPAICAQHRAALEAFHGIRPTVGSQLGSILEAVISGKKPPAAQVNQVVAGVVGRVMGREISADEIAEARARMARGESPWPSGESDSESDGMGEAWKKVQEHMNARRQRKTAEHDPAKARAEYERQQRLRAITKAREVMGYGPKEAVKKDELKARYRDLAKKYHPDRPGGSVERMQELNEAMEVLQGSR